MVNKSKIKYKRALNLILKELRKIAYSEDPFKVITQAYDVGERNRIIQNLVIKKYKIEPHVYNYMLGQLIEDDYIENIETPRIKTKGISFINNGGYTIESIIKYGNLIWKVVSSFVLIVASVLGIIFAFKNDKSEQQLNEIKLLKKEIDSIQKTNMIRFYIPKDSLINKIK